MTKIFSWLNEAVWGAPALLLILGVGLYLSLRLEFVQLTLFPAAVKGFLLKFRRRNSREGVSPLQALCTALAATVGTGNLVGVAGAICLGGPGAIFWMWICGLLGMVTKYAEAVLAVRFRVKTEGGWIGGPMYVMQQRLGKPGRWMAVVYSFFGLAASFGVGNAAQINAVIGSVGDVVSRFGGEPDRRFALILGILLATLIGIMLLGGGKRIGTAAQLLVPFAAGAYILLCAGVLISKADRIPSAFAVIFQGAFSPRAVTGGVLGSAFQALRIGCSRGVFTNEAGMGTASIAHASAAGVHPAEQGLMGIMEVFLDTILMCTLTALVILVSGVPVPYGADAGGELTARAFASVYGQGAPVFLSAALCCFAVATVLGWGLYGGRCAQFLFGSNAWKGYALAQTAMVVLSAVMDTGTVWQISELLNGLMVIPNLITLAVMTPEVRRLTKEYKNLTALPPVEVLYADFYQCKPLRTLSYAEIPPSGGGSKKGRQENLSSEHRSA